MIMCSLELKMEWSKCLLLSVAIVSVSFVPLFHCQHNADVDNKLMENATKQNPTPTLSSIVDPEAYMTEEIYKLLPPIEEEIHKLSKEDFKIFLKKVLVRLKSDYEKLRQIYENIETEEDDSSNSTLIRRVKRTFKKGGGGGGGGCNTCGGGYSMPMPVFVQPVYKPSYGGGGGGCGGGCGQQRPSYNNYCNTCGGGGYGGGYSQASAQASSYG